MKFCMNKSLQDFCGDRNRHPETEPDFRIFHYCEIDSLLTRLQKKLRWGQQKLLFWKLHAVVGYVFSTPCRALNLGVIKRRLECTSLK